MCLGWNIKNKPQKHLSQKARVKIFWDVIQTVRNYLPCDSNSVGKTTWYFLTFEFWRKFWTFPEAWVFKKSLNKFGQVLTSFDNKEWYEIDIWNGTAKCDKQYNCQRKTTKCDKQNNCQEKKYKAGYRSARKADLRLKSYWDIRNNNSIADHNVLLWDQKLAAFFWPHDSNSKAKWKSVALK